jgi:dTDP-4-amino-4,6-dideoxygalactose transaminase
MHLQPIFQKYPRYINGISENLFEKGLCLPSGSNSSEDDLSRVIEVLNNF